MAFTQLLPDHDAYPASVPPHVHVFAQRLQWRDGQWDVTFSPRSEYAEAVEWCRDHIEPYSWNEIGDSYLVILTVPDALAFKMRWCA
jgi:hypothetical protein